MQTNLALADAIVGGTFAPSNLNAPTGCIGDAQIAAAAGIKASKLQHQYVQPYSQPGASNAAVERKVAHVVRGATGLVVDFNVGARVAAIGGATATIDLQANGVSLLTTPVSLTSATAAYALLAGSLAAGAASLTAGMVIEVVVSAATVGGGTLAQGLFAEVNIREDAQ
jgi:hypothetical protein